MVCGHQPSYCKNTQVLREAITDNDDDDHDHDHDHDGDDDLDDCIINYVCLLCFACLFLLLYVPCQQLWSLRDGQFT